MNRCTVTLSIYESLHCHMSIYESLHCHLSIYDLLHCHLSIYVMFTVTRVYMNRCTVTWVYMIYCTVTWVSMICLLSHWYIYSVVQTPEYLWLVAPSPFLLLSYQIHTEKVTRRGVTLARVLFFSSSDIIRIHRDTRRFKTYWVGACRTRYLDNSVKNNSVWMID